MRLYDSIPLKFDIPGPNCPKCGLPMWLARIEPDKPDYDRRTFECPECDHSLTEVVKYR
jgi:transposase-like protein